MGSGGKPEPDADVDWPDEADESSFLSEAAARGEAPKPAEDRSSLPVAGEKLPSLDETVGRVPAPVLALLDDLFRAKFTSVRRYAAEPLAPDSGRGRDRPGPG